MQIGGVTFVQILIPFRNFKTGMERMDARLKFHTETCFVQILCARFCLRNSLFFNALWDNGRPALTLRLGKQELLCTGFGCSTAFERCSRTPAVKSILSRLLECIVFTRCPISH